MMDGVFAYDTGCVSSGIKDTEFKYFLRLNVDYTFLLATELSKQYLNSNQYDIETIKNLIDWMERELDIDL